MAVETAAARNLPKRRQLSIRGTWKLIPFHSVLLLFAEAEAEVGSVAAVSSGSFPARRKERRGVGDIGLSNTIGIFLDR